MKLLIILFLFNFKAFSYTGIEEYVPGETIRLDDINDRLIYIENLHINKNINITLPRFQSGAIKANDINQVVNAINNLELLGNGIIEQVNPGQIIDADQLNRIVDGLNYAKHICLNRNDCYSRVQEIINGEISHLLIRDNFTEDTILVKDENSNLLKSNQNLTYLGTECDAWYTESEKSWASIKMESDKNNHININYTSPVDQTNHIVYNNSAPTCGTLYYYGNQYCRTYGYPYLWIEGTEYLGSGSGIMGNGGCWNGSGTIFFNKNDQIVIGSHWGSIIQIMTGY